MQRTPSSRPSGGRVTDAANYRRLTVSTVLVAPDGVPGGPAGPEGHGREPAGPGGGPEARAAYLRGLERHLRGLARRGGPVRLAAFDTGDYLDHCHRTGADPGAHAVRAAYAGERVADTAAVPYRGQPVDRALAELAAAEGARRTWERCADLLAAADRCPRCGGPGAECAFQQAADTVTELLRRAGPGSRLVCTLSDTPEALSAAMRHGDDPGRPETGGAASSEPRGARPSPLACPEGLLLCMVLSAALATGGDAGLLLRTVPATPPREMPPPQELRGWEVHGGRVRALSATEVAVACAAPVDAREASGSPDPVGAAVVHRTALELPGYRCRPM
ncbi:hypothetical protein [Streptomyces spiramenti]|uniref:Uncharacterized protein n=1 Tax=Streptomyces spiramenti TaxID=2720606 RepID=A0ABX1AR03_9ACTN|nr:hypothetical protein [Streptomyces spiramenti]NJP68254.1 hypothetical protein [Streptomyces spiramenti]